MSNDKFVILTLYVDDILLAGNNKEYLLVNGYPSISNERHKISILYILGVKIHQNCSNRLLTLS